MERNKEVLIVDDVGFNRILIEKCFNPEEYSFESVSSAQEGLHLLGKKRFDVVITDFMMPGMNGLEFYRQTREQTLVDDKGEVKTPPFILCTAVYNREILEEAFREGFVDVVLKPVSRERLYEAVKKAFGRGVSEPVVLQLNPQHSQRLEALSHLYRGNAIDIVGALLEGVTGIDFGPDVDSPNKLANRLKSSLSEIQ